MTPEARPDQILGGRYRLLERLGAGGFGRVWKARDETLSVDVAVKEVWLPPAASDAERTERLRRAEREARNAARLRDHPNIVAVHDVVVDGDAPWIVMRLVNGCSLQEHLTAHGPMPVDRVLGVATALLRALGAAHQVGIAHRDVKPANIMLASTGEILLTDFGIAVHQADTALTATNAFIGSVEYTAPERLRGTDSPASDLFSLGVTLYQAVEGVSPFRRDTATAAITAVLFDEPPPPRRAGVRLAPLITRLLNKNPDQRTTIPKALALTDTPSTPATEPMTVPSRPPPTKRETRPAPPPRPEMPNPMWRQAAAFLIMVFLISFSPIGIADLLTGEFANRPVSASTFVGLFVAVNAFISPDWVSKDSSAIGRGVLGILAAIIVGGDIAAGSGFLQANTPRAATWISLIIVAVLYSVALWMMVPPKKRTWPRG